MLNFRDGGISYWAAIGGLVLIVLDPLVTFISSWPEIAIRPDGTTSSYIVQAFLGLALVIALPVVGIFLLTRGGRGAPVVVTLSAVVHILLALLGNSLWSWAFVVVSAIVAILVWLPATRDYAAKKRTADG